MKKNYLYGIIVVLIILNVLIIKYSGIFNRKYQKQENIEVYDYVGKILLKNIEVQIENDEKFINNIEIELKNHEIKKLNNLLGSKPKLIFRISESNCPMCIDYELNVLKRYINKIGAHNVILLTSYKDSRMVKILLEHYDLNCMIYNTKEKLLNINIEQYNTPYYFVADSTLKTKFVFIPSKDIPHYSEKYLQQISNKLKDF